MNSKATCEKWSPTFSRTEPKLETEFVGTQTVALS
jgi:hypothetical protein